MKIEYCSGIKPNMEENSLLEGHVVKEKWRVVKKIGQGAYGQVYKCEDLETKKEVALKLFVGTSRATSFALQKREVQILKELKGKNFFPQFIGQGRNERFDYLVMELLGENLQQIRKKQPENKFTLSTAVRMGRMMLESIHNMHIAGFVHRDIKPANFAIGLENNKHTLYILDFGFAKNIFTENGDVIPPRNNVSYRGTPRYSSVNVLNNKESGRADDLISLFYTMYELIVGELPWKIVKHHEMPEYKKNYDHELLLQCLPEEFRNFYEHVKDLRYEDAPNYQLLFSTFDNIKSKRAIKDNDEFDFDVKNTEEKPISVSALHSKSSEVLVFNPSSTIKRKTSFISSRQNNTFCSMGSSLFQPEELSLSSENKAQTGLPLCWSCPTFSHFIRSNLKPPLKQMASINENVYEFDVRRNVAAKQIEDFPQINERRNSLPYILDTKSPLDDDSHLKNKIELENELGNLKPDGYIPNEIMLQEQEISTDGRITKDSDRSVGEITSISQNNLIEKSFKDMLSDPKKNTNGYEIHSISTNVCETNANESFECNPLVKDQIISSISETIMELLGDEPSLFSSIYLPHRNLNTTCCENEINSNKITNNKFSETSSKKGSVNVEQKPVNRRHRITSENKYVKDESELKLNFFRRRQRHVLLSDENHSTLQYSDELILQNLNPVQSILNERTFPEYFQDQSISKRISHEMLQPPPGEPTYPCLPSRRQRYRREGVSLAMS